MYRIVTKVCVLVERDLMLHGISNLYHYYTYYMFEKLQNDHVLCMNGVTIHEGYNGTL